jgi:DNA primase large subunit
LKVKYGIYLPPPITRDTLLENMVGMLVSKPEYAKYPFIKEVSEYISSVDVRLEELVQRIEETLNVGVVSWENQANEAEREIEVLSFPIAAAIVINLGDDFLRRRFADAESKRSYRLLVETENDGKVVENAVKYLQWRARVLPLGRRPRPSAEVALNFVDYLRYAVRFHEDEWKLVNRTLSGGEVFLRKNELARLIMEEAKARLGRMLERSPRAELPPSLTKRVEEIRRELGQRKEKLRTEELPKAIVVAAFPPCVKKLNDALTDGQHLSHMGRFTLTSFFLRIGRSAEELVKLYTSVSDFSESITRYQVEHIAGQKGSGTQYTPPNCRSLQTHNLCPGPDDLCRTVRHPLSYYRRKANMVQDVRTV